MTVSQSPSYTILKFLNLSNSSNPKILNLQRYKTDRAENSHLLEELEEEIIWHICLISDRWFMGYQNCCIVSIVSFSVTWLIDDPTNCFSSCYGHKQNSLNGFFIIKSLQNITNQIKGIIFLREVTLLTILTWHLVFQNKDHTQGLQENRMLSGVLQFKGWLLSLSAFRFTLWKFSRRSWTRVNTWCSRRCTAFRGRCRETTGMWLTWRRAADRGWKPSGTQQ